MGVIQPLKDSYDSIAVDEVITLGRSSEGGLKGWAGRGRRGCLRISGLAQKTSTSVFSTGVPINGQA